MTETDIDYYAFSDVNVFAEFIYNKVQILFRYSEVIRQSDSRRQYGIFPRFQSA